MELFVVLIEDRHTDVQVEVFSGREDAIRYAQWIAVNWIRPGATITEQQVDGWEYYATYSSEDDSVRVERKVLNAALAEMSP